MQMTSCQSRDAYGRNQPYCCNVAVTLGTVARDRRLAVRHQHGRGLLMTGSDFELALCGFSKNPFPSLERSRQWYLEAFRKNYRIVSIDSGAFPPPVDAIFSFSGKLRLGSGIRPPIIIPLHGGAVVSQLELHQLVRNLRDCDRLIVNSSADTGVLGEWHVRPENILCPLKLPIDTLSFRRRSKREAKAALGFTSRDVLIGFVGRLLPQKGVHWFLDVVSRVREALPSKRIKAIIVGNFQRDYPILPYCSASQFKAYLENKVAELGLGSDILLLGGPDDDVERSHIYTAIDVLVSPTNTVDENFGYVPLEAMACGVPVVGYGYGGLKDSIHDGSNGFLAHTWVTRGGIRGDLRTLVKRVTELAIDDELRKRMGMTACDYVKRHHSFRQFERGLCQIVDDAIGQRRNVKPVRSLNLRRTPGWDSPLPNTAPDWKEMFYPVSKYASTSVANIEAHSIIWPAGRFENVSGSVFRLDDPCWPATYTLRKMQRELLAACERGRSFRSLARKFGKKFVLDALLRGILNFSR